MYVGAAIASVCILDDVLDISRRVACRYRPFDDGSRLSVIVARNHSE